MVGQVFILLIRLRLWSLLSRSFLILLDGINIIWLLASFSLQHQMEIFHWSLSDKSPRVSMTLLNILADLNSVVVWMVSTRPFISMSSSSCINPFVALPRAPIIIGITVTFIFPSFFYSLARSRYLSFFSLLL